MQGLSLTRVSMRVSMVGVSLGGWLALDYATQRPERVASVAVVCPAGVGRQKLSIVFKTVPLRMLGAWGKRKASELVLGRAPANSSPALQYFLDFMSLIHKTLRPRMVKLPIFSDQALQRLTMPVMAILGGKDVLLDSAETELFFSWSATFRISRFVSIRRPAAFPPASDHSNSRIPLDARAIP